MERNGFLPARTQCKWPASIGCIRSAARLHFSPASITVRWPGTSEVPSVSGQDPRSLKIIFCAA